MDLARSIQDVTEEVMLKMAAFAGRQTGLRDLCLAGGVALNCVGNGRILREGPFDHLWVQPAAGDAGGALGVALALWHRHLGKERLSPERAGAWEREIPAHRGSARSGCDRGSKAPRKYADGMNGSYLGPRFSGEEIARFLDDNSYPARRIARSELAGTVAQFIADGKVVGLFLGRMEFGPRALGARSIVGDPRSPTMQSVMNLKIKFRESFRPFAPAVLREHVSEWFELDVDSPYMLLVADVVRSHRLSVPPEEAARWGIDRLNVPRSDIPAVTHVDYSARVQTVRRELHPTYYAIIEAFYGLTGCPLVVNTSFNVRGEPIVCTPEDAYRCFMRTNMDVLVLEEFVLQKIHQAPAPHERWGEVVLD
jgi:carbamoyltransferase